MSKPRKPKAQPSRDPRLRSAAEAQLARSGAAAPEPQAKTPLASLRLDRPPGLEPAGAGSESPVVRTAMSDLSVRKQAEEALRESAEFARRMIEISEDCIKVLDLDGHLLSMSEGGRKLLKIDDLAPDLNQSWVDFWEDRDRAAALTAVAQARQGEAGNFCGFCETAKGTPKWWEVIVSPIKDADGSINRLLAVSRDITARRQAEKMLLTASEQRRLVLEAAGMGAWDYRFDTGEARFSGTSAAETSGASRKAARLATPQPSPPFTRTIVRPRTRR